MNFLHALELVLVGGVVRRESWRGTVCYVRLTQKAAFENSPGEVVDLAPALVARPMNGMFVAWNPTQADLLADDWEMVPELSQPVEVANA